jgi:hypothetical protein
MKGHLGAVLTSGLSAVALALAVLQAAVVFAHASANATARTEVSSAATPARPVRRFSAPGGRAGIPYQWNAEPPSRAQPDTHEKREEPRRTPPRSRGGLPEQGPRPPRKLAA